MHSVRPNSDARQLRLPIADQQKVGGSRLSVYAAKKKLSITDGTGEALRGVCCIFMRNNRATAITEQNIAQVYSVAISTRRHLRILLMLE